MKNKICGIYKVTNLVNFKILIGQSINIVHRWELHKGLLKRNKHHNPHFQNAWNKYGEQNFKFEIILECLKNKLDEEEIRLIKEHKATDRKIGYNIAEGGKAPKFPEETRRKMSESRKGDKNYNYGKHLSEETKAKLSTINTGKNHPQFGTHQSVENRKKKSEALKRHWKNMTEEDKEKIRETRRNCSEETREKLSRANRGKKLSEEHKKKISIAFSGENHPFYGKHLTEKHKENIGNANRGKVSFRLNQQLPDEHKQKIKESIIKWWAKRKNLSS